MVRQRYYHDPSRKHIEAYQDFSGGLNTMSSNDNMKDNELSYLQNVDLGERGSLKRRKGFTSQEIGGIDGGLPQMISRYYRKHVPYNLLGIDGAFEGQLERTGQYHQIGNWRNIFTQNADDIFKAPTDRNPNLVTNGSFEDGENGWVLDNYNSRVIEVDNANTGTHVLLLERPTGDTQHYKNEYQEEWHDTEEGKTYFLEAVYRKAPNRTMPYKVHVIAWIEWEDGTRNTMAKSHYYPDNASKQKAGDDWITLEKYIQMPAKAKKVTFGVGFFDDPTKNSYQCGVHFDSFFVREEINGLSQSALGIRATLDHTSRNRGVAIDFDGLKPNTYYIMAADYKTDGMNTRASLAIRDPEVISANTYGSVMYIKDFEEQASEWTTIYMAFPTHSRQVKGQARLYNRSDVGATNNIYFDNVRLYELKSSEYENIDQLDVEELFPFRIGRLREENIYETVVAINGNFYIDGVEKSVEGNIPIQSERPMEAAMYKDYLFIASGSGFLVYNGSTIAKVEPYKPAPLEELYIGTNALLENPFTVSDEESEAVEIREVKFSSRYGKTNDFITVSVGVARPEFLNIEYKFERRNVLDKPDYWFTLSDWSSDNEATFITDIAGEYQFKISVRERGKETVLEEYMVPKYIIKPSEDENDVLIDGNTIDQCNRILVHWDRIILYGDQAKHDVIYISELFNPAYFPMNNTLQFENPKSERITSIVRYRNNLVVFTPSTIQALYGTNPNDFQRVVLNTGIGCIADRSAEVVANHIVFLSYEGISLLKSIGMSETRSNVEIIDGNIKSLVEMSENAVAYVRNNQYCLVYPSSNKQLRYYYEWGVWTHDVSPSLDFHDVVIEDSKLIALGNNGRILLDAEDYQDEGVPFKEIIETKFYTFGEPYATKKTKELQIMYDAIEEETDIYVNVSLDTTADIADTNVSLNTQDTIYYLTIAGKGLMTKVKIEHEENKPLTLVGLGLIFKLKKP